MYAVIISDYDVTLDVEYVQKMPRSTRGPTSRSGFASASWPKLFIMTNDGQCRSLHIEQHCIILYNPVQPSLKKNTPWPLALDRLNSRYVISVAAFTGPQTKTRLNAAEAVGKATVILQEKGCDHQVKSYGNHWKKMEKKYIT